MTRISRVARIAGRALLTLVLLAASTRQARAEPTGSDEPGSVIQAQSVEPGGPPPAGLAKDPRALLALSEEAMVNIDYPKSRALAARAIEAGGLEIDELTRAYRILALSNAQLDDADAAERAFIRLLALEPESNVAMRLSPAKRSAVLNARGFWSLHKGEFGIDVSYARRERQIVVRVHDPLQWGKGLHVWWRFANHPYSKVERSPLGEALVDVTGIGPAETLEVYAFVTDERRNTVLRFGRERVPHVFALTEEEFGALLRRDIRGGQTGSYARRLEELGVDVGVHGYASLELKPQGDVETFDLHHATVMVRANLQRAVSLELAFEWEHLGRESEDFYLPHAFLDVKLHEMFVVRAGFFEAPVGAFNEYLYPDFLRITGLPPLFAGGVVPALWSEVGVQARGRAALGSVAAFTYAAFVSNGLEQPDPTPHDGVVEEGGDISAMRFHARDELRNDKAGGGRLGLEIDEFDVGVSGYTGRYTVDEFRLLSMLDADLSFRNDWLTVRSEAAVAFEEVTGRVLEKYGGYLLVAGRPIPYLEPYVQYDYVNMDAASSDYVEMEEDSLHRGLLGVAVYPFPLDRATRSLRLKNEAGLEFPNSSDSKFVWFFQLTTGF